MESKNPISDPIKKGLDDLMFNLIESLDPKRFIYHYHINITNINKNEDADDADADAIGNDSNDYEIIKVSDIIPENNTKDGDDIKLTHLEEILIVAGRGLVDTVFIKRDDFIRFDDYYKLLFWNSRLFNFKLIE